MTYTPQTVLGEELAVNLGPWLTLSGAWYADAIGAEFEPLATLLTEQGFDGQTDYVPPYGAIFNPETTPYAFIPYVAQFEGQTIPVTATQAEAQRLLQTAPNRNRGSQSSMIMAIKADLVGTQSLVLQPRHRPDGTLDADWFTVVIKPEELLWNILPNGSFEHDTVGSAPAGWSTLSAGSPSLLTASNWSSIGSQSAAFTATSTASGQYLGTEISSPSIIAGNTYTATVTVNASAIPPNGLFLQLQWYDGITQLSVSSSAALTTTGIHTITVTGTAPTSTTGIEIALVSGATTAGGQALTFEFDGAIMQQGSAVPIYVDGDTHGYEWSGGSEGFAVTSVLPQLLADVAAVKPAGIQWYSNITTYARATAIDTNPVVTTDGIIWSEATNSYSAEPNSLTWQKTATVTP